MHYALLISLLMECSHVSLLGQDTKKEAKKPRKSGGLGGSSSDESDSDSASVKEAESDNDSFKSVSSGEDDEDDFNPFRDESSEDDEDGKLKHCKSSFKVAVMNMSFCKMKSVTINAV